MLQTGRLAGLAALVLAASVAFTQAADRQDRSLIDAARRLTANEIATVLNLSQKAVSGKTFRFTAITGDQTPTEVLMGSAGQPRIMRSTGSIIGGLVSASGAAGRPSETRWRREFIRIIDYTGQPAYRCGETSARGELVVEYERDTSATEWTTRARLRDGRDFGGLGIVPIFALLQGSGRIASEERRQIKGRWARAFVSPWMPPPTPRRSAEPALLIGDPIPNVVGEPAPGEAIQTLWVDTESLLPLRWATSKRGVLLHGYDFTYAPIEIQPPSDAQLPECVR